MIRKAERTLEQPASAENRTFIAELRLRFRKHDSYSRLGRFGCQYPRERDSGTALPERENITCQAAVGDTA